jgi:hypothetical protein
VSSKRARRTGCAANRKKGFYTSRLPKNEKIRLIFAYKEIVSVFLYQAAKNFVLFSKFQDQNEKIKNLRD